MRIGVKVLIILICLSTVLIFVCAGCGKEEGYPEVVPTTLDVTLKPMFKDGIWFLGLAPGEPHIYRNDLGAHPVTYDDENRIRGKRLSLAYFMVFSDAHITDEESPTRMNFFDSNTILNGLFKSSERPPADLTPHILNALVRTANAIQKDYDRDFDMALFLGDAIDNSQKNELEWFIDIIRGIGFTSGIEGYARIDSGELDIASNGLNRGERFFGQQEFDREGNNINPYNREGMPNSNADIPVVGLKKSSGEDVPFFIALGNHDVIGSMFDPYGIINIFSLEDYIGSVAKFGYIPGLASLIWHWEQNPNEPIYVSLGIDWRIIFRVLDSLDLIPYNYFEDIDPRFDLSVLQNGTPRNPNDDGIIIAPDENRRFLGYEGFIPLANGFNMGFSDNNGDGRVDALDGGYYRVDWRDLNSKRYVPLRLLVLDGNEEAFLLLHQGGFSQAQLAWLDYELKKAVEDKVLVIVASHYSIDELGQGKEQLLHLLHNCPNVILYLAGHAHRHSVIPRKSSDGDPLKGFWEVITSSSTKFPAQARIIEIVDNRDSTGSIYLTLFDFWNMNGDDADKLALFGREITFRDIYEAGYDTGKGSAKDRNVVLKFQIPRDVYEVLKDIYAEPNEVITSEESLGKRYRSPF